jgi:hypothetical protein
MRANLNRQWITGSVNYTNYNLQIPSDSCQNMLVRIPRMVAAMGHISEGKWAHRGWWNGDKSENRSPQYINKESNCRTLMMLPLILPEIFSDTLPFLLIETLIT